MNILILGRDTLKFILTPCVWTAMVVVILHQWEVTPGEVRDPEEGKGY